MLESRGHNYLRRRCTYARPTDRSRVLSKSTPLIIIFYYNNDIIITYCISRKFDFGRPTRIPVPDSHFFWDDESNFMIATRYEINVIL